MNILEMKGIYKAFPGIVAVDHVDLELEKGEVLALIGENGAGKSTLIKILSGAYTADDGVICVDGKEYRSYNTREAIDLGIGIVYQELNYLGAMSIAENLFIGRVPTKGRMKKVDYKKLYADAKVVMDQFGLGHRDPAMEVGELSVAEKQLVEIARAFTRDVKILVMDEPTSALNDVETENLFKLVRAMKARGVSIIYISHRLSEIFEIADNVMVMRDGKKVARVSVKDTDTDQLVAYMVGREIKDMYPKRVTTPGRDIFRVEDLRTDFLKGVSFNVREGEVVGLFGLMGAGRTEVAECIIGSRKHTGKMEIDGKAYSPKSPLDSLRNGIAYVPAERKSEGVCLISPVRDNVTIANLKKFAPKGIMHLKEEKQIASEWVKKLGIKTPGIMTEVDSLSGGNQQKVVVGNWLNTEPAIMMYDEPSRGIDVNAKQQIFEIMWEQSRHGVSTIFVSSELEELLEVCHRILIMRNGKITGEVRPEDININQLYALSMGDE